MGFSLNNIIYGAIALFILFLLMGSITINQFGSSWKYCQQLRWNCDEAGAQGANCTAVHTNQNTSAVTNGTDYTQDGATYPAVADLCANYCLNCETEGGYRTSNQGMLLLVMVIAIIGFGLYFIKWRL